MDRDVLVTDTVASYENILNLHEGNRLTEYWGDFGGYVENRGVSKEQMEEKFQMALKEMKISEQELSESADQLVSRLTLEKFMRERINEAGREKLMEQSFEIVTLFDKQVLFTNERINRSHVPDGMYCYDIRHDDDCQGDMAELKDHVMVNHWGTVLCKEPFQDREFNGRFYSTQEGIIIEDDDYNYTGEMYSVSDYCKDYDTLVDKLSEQTDGEEMNLSM